MRVATFEARLKDVSTVPRVSFSCPSVVESYLRQLKDTMNKNEERARDFLSKLIGPVTLRREGAHLVTEVRGNLEALLGFGDPHEVNLYGGTRGAGSGI